MEAVAAVDGRHLLAKLPMIPLVHQALAPWGAILATPWVLALFSELAVHLGWKVYLSELHQVMYGTPYFPIQVGLSLFLGWVVGGTLRHRCIIWVWILPFVSLCFALVGVSLIPAPSFASLGYPLAGSLTIAQSTGLSLSSRLTHFFGWGYRIQPFNQVVATLPFYCAAVYSIGAVVASRLMRAPVFFETMRNLRKKRLIFLVAAPWLCLKLMLNWQQTMTQYPVLRTGGQLRVYLQGLVIASVFVALVFAIAVSTAGRRFAVTRFFLDPREAPTDKSSGAWDGTPAGS